MQTISLDDLSSITGGTDWNRVRSAFKVGAVAGGYSGAVYGLATAPAGPIAIPVTVGATFLGAMGGGATFAAGEYLRQNVRR